VSGPASTRDEVFAAAPGLAVTEALFASLDDVVFCVKNRKFQYVAVNGGFVRRVGARNRQAVLGRTARDLFPAHLAKGYELQDEQVFATGQELSDRMEMITHADGSTGWYVARKIPVLDVKGRIIALASISHDLRSPLGSDERLGPLGAIIERIQRDFAQPLRINDLARKAGLSLNRLERGMRSVLRISPRQLLTKTRIEAAARLLRESRRPIGEIAAECGFYDQAIFCRQFRAATGLTPGRYRAGG
jgi:AraC-like DNA-binding protein